MSAENAHTGTLPMNAQALAEQIATPEDLSQILHIHAASVRRLASQGKIPHRRAGRRYLFHLPTVQRWLEAGEPIESPPETLNLLPAQEVMPEPNAPTTHPLPKASTPRLQRGARDVVSQTMDRLIQIEQEEHQHGKAS